jgi:hypothetical protein
MNFNIGHSLSSFLNGSVSPQPSSGNAPTLPLAGPSHPIQQMLVDGVDFPFAAGVEGTDRPTTVVICPEGTHPKTTKDGRTITVECVPDRKPGKKSVPILP